ncbi:MAG: ABC transporter ATP-binding protein [Planctomycetota bacterium]
MAEDETIRTHAGSMRRLFGLYTAESGRTVLAVIVAVALSGGQLLPNLLIRSTVNHIEAWFRGGREGPIGLWPYAFAVLGAAALVSLLRFAHGLTRAGLVVRIANRLRERMYEAVQRHSLSYHKQQTTGDLIARATRDIQSIARFVGFGVFGTADIVVFLGGATLVLFFINPVFAALALCPVPVAIFCMVRFSSGMQTRWREASEAYGKVTTVLQENIAGARVVRAFAQERAEERRFGGRADEYVGRVIAVVRYWVIRMISADFIFSLVMPIALTYGASQVIAGRLGLGDVMLCFLFMRPVQHRLRHLIQILEICQNAAAGADRVFEILDEEPGIRSRPGAGPVPPPPEGEGAWIEFRNVSFGYDPEKPVLRDISFTAEPGRTIGIVGRTGSGKSTLISLIPRFHDPTGGAVLVNGTDVREIALRSLRRSVGIIFQETFLFSTTVRENIAYGEPEAELAAVEAAAGAARADDFIAELDDGYGTVVGERGFTLSGGQAQRLAIARAILLDPLVLIMDDATASVDSETERRIHQTLRRVSRGRTTFVIAHRISSVAHADRILVLDDGRIAEQGTHAELFALGGIYRRMCDQQLAGDRQGDHD